MKDKQRTTAAVASRRSICIAAVQKTMQETCLYTSFNRFSALISGVQKNQTLNVSLMFSVNFCNSQSVCLSVRPFISFSFVKTFVFSVFTFRMRQPKSLPIPQS